MQLSLQFAALLPLALFSILTEARALPADNGALQVSSPGPTSHGILERRALRRNNNLRIDTSTSWNNLRKREPAPIYTPPRASSGLDVNTWKALRYVYRDFIHDPKVVEIMKECTTEEQFAKRMVAKVELTYPKNDVDALWNFYVQSYRSHLLGAASSSGQQARGQVSPSLARDIPTRKREILDNPSRLNQVDEFPSADLHAMEVVISKAAYAIRTKGDDMPDGDAQALWNMFVEIWNERHEERRKFAKAEVGGNLETAEVSRRV